MYTERNETFEESILYNKCGFYLVLEIPKHQNQPPHLKIMKCCSVLQQKKKSGNLKNINTLVIWNRVRIESNITHLSKPRNSINNFRVNSEVNTQILDWGFSKDFEAFVAKQTLSLKLLGLLGEKEPAAPSYKPQRPSWVTGILSSNIPDVHFQSSIRQRKKSENSHSWVYKQIPMILVNPKVKIQKIQV